MFFNEIHHLVINFLFENEVRKALNVYKEGDIKVAIIIKILKIFYEFWKIFHSENIYKIDSTAKELFFFYFSDG